MTAGQHDADKATHGTGTGPGRSPDHPPALGGAPDTVGGDADKALDRDAAHVREELRGSVAHITARPDLYARVAQAAAQRRRRRRLTGSALVLAATGLVAAVVVANPNPAWLRDEKPAGTFPAAPASIGAPQNPGTSMRECPGTDTRASSPGATGDKLIPDHPGAVLVCDEILTPGENRWEAHLYEGADADRLAAAINQAAATPYVAPEGVCLMLAPKYPIFFRNSAGQEAVLQLEGPCYNVLTDGRLGTPRFWPQGTSPDAWLRR